LLFDLKLEVRAQLAIEVCVLLPPATATQTVKKLSPTFHIKFL
jgi:hypothetical protein